MGRKTRHHEDIEIVTSIKNNSISLQDKSIICVASKVIFISENRIFDLNQVEVSDIAYQIHKKIPRKNPRVIQKRIDSTGQKDGKRVEILGDYIGAWLPNGLKLTSGGVDKYEENKVVLLPENPDMSAKKISSYISEKLGATQISIGVYGKKSSESCKDR